MILPPFMDIIEKVLKYIVKYLINLFIDECFILEIQNLGKYDKMLLLFHFQFKATLR